jgi:hypothetical protein
VLPCVNAFVADEFCVWATILRTCLALRWGAQLADVRVALGHPTSGRADVPCVALGRPTCGRADVPCVALGRPTCGRADVPCVALGRPTCGRALRWGRALPLRCGHALGRPTCGRALRCVGAPNLRTCLVLRLGAHLADVPCVALGRPTLVRPY